MESRYKSFGNYWLAVLKSTLRIWLQAQSVVYAAALAFFTLFSMAPVMIMVVMFVGLIVGESSVQDQLMQHLESTVGEQAASVIQTAFQNSRVEKSGVFPAVAGFAAMVLGATTVFAQMQVALNSIWGVAPRPNRGSLKNFVLRRLTSLLVVLGIGFVLLVSMALSVAISAAMEYARGWMPMFPWVAYLTDNAVSLVVTTLLFSAIFRILPDVVLSWKDVFLGGFVTALLFVLGRILISIYLSRTAPASAYGAAGALVLVLLWVNYSSMILLMGSAFTRAQLQARGGKIKPRSGAALVRRELELA